ncbi:MAG: NAD-dependent epimerase/dehydratase family protein [Clostridia bacterium]|nr:NAD-dependent epimerase/dehydratase family protein [Clostridia bacterium]
MKKVLVIGGTGTMGRYLCPLLAQKGYEVDAIAGEIKKDSDGIRYHFANALDNRVLEQYLSKGYDAVVDFMWYRDISSYESRYRMFLNSTDHYFALSSYRVYADSPNAPLTEDSPRLSESLHPCDIWHQSTGYAQIKCRMEDLLTSSKEKNWTILRPTVVYCPGRVPLVTWSKNEIVLRAYAGKKIVLPYEALDKKTTMIWGEDVAKMIGGLMFHPAAKREIYNVATAETLTWGEVLAYYQSTLGLEAEFCDTEDFLRLIAGENPSESKLNWAKFILHYDRLYHRSVDNSKVLRDAGLKQEELMPIREGLRLAAKGILPKDFDRLDAYLEERAREKN